MQYGKKLLTPPAVEPLTADLVKSHLRIDQTEDDTVITTVWIPAVRQLVEKFTERSLITQTWRITLDAFPWGRRRPYRTGDDAPRRDGGGGASISYGTGIDLPVSPVQSIAAIGYFDFGNNAAVLDPAVYDLDTTTLPARVLPVYSSVWPTTYPRTAAVQVDVVCGFGDDSTTIPADLIGAMLLQIELWYSAGEVAPANNLSRAVTDILTLNWSGNLG